MKQAFLTFMIAFFGFANAQTILSQAGDVYEGNEYYNYKSTGKKCQITLMDVRENTISGLHCYDIDVEYNFSEHQNELPLSSRVTFRDQGRQTCADLNRSKSTEQSEVFSENTENTYNRIFIGGHDTFWKSHNYFVIFHPVTKAPKEARFHYTGVFSSKDWQCLNLRPKY